MHAIVFEVGDAWWFYAAFIAFVTVLLVLDLKVFHREAHSVSTKEALLWSLVWMSLALLFALGLYLVLPGVLTRHPELAARMPGKSPHEIGTQLTHEFLTGYVVEMSLSVDNLFVFIVIFS